MNSGTFVTLKRCRLDGEITARRSPGGALMTIEQRMANIITTIPHGARALYVCSKEDSFNAAMRKNSRGPYGFSRVSVVYHFIIWEGRPVWVSNAEATLEQVNDQAG